MKIGIKQPKHGHKHHKLCFSFILNKIFFPAFEYFFICLRPTPKTIDAMRKACQGWNCS